MRDERQQKFHFISPTSVSLPKSQLPLIKEAPNSSRELFPLQGLIFVVTKAQVSLPGNKSLHQQHQPNVDGKHTGMSCYPPG